MLADQALDDLSAFDPRGNFDRLAVLRWVLLSEHDDAITILGGRSS